MRFYIRVVKTVKYFINIGNRDDEELKIYASEERIYKDSMSKIWFLDKCFSKLSGGKFVREFYFTSDKTLRVVWASSMVDSFEEHYDTLVFYGRDDVFMKKMRDMEIFYRRDEISFKERYDATCEKLRRQLAFRETCYEVMGEYSRTGKIDTHGYDLKDIVAYIKEYKRTLWPKLNPAKLPLKYNVLGLFLSLLGIGYLAFFLWSFIGGYFSNWLPLTVFGFLFSGVNLWYNFEFRERKIYNQIVNELEWTSEHQEEYGANQKEKELKEEITKDDYREWLSADVMYMRAHPEFNFLNEIEVIKKLKEDYAKNREREIEENELLNREQFMLRLLDLESDIFSKDKKLGRKAGFEVVFSINKLRNRLAYVMGSSEVYEDCFLESIYEAIRLLTNKPFYGCEVDILKFYRLAVLYVSARAQMKDMSSFEKSPIFEKLVADRRIAEGISITRMNEAYGYSELDKLLRDMEAHLRIDLSTGTSLSETPADEPNQKEEKKLSLGQVGEKNGQPM